ncbi:MAG: dTDP-glucose 4,6-dehydratase [Bacteroidales bacterium]|nr:dTDP-glucose 4,6-dehydratase [Bacteroidales bacterium]
MSWSRSVIVTGGAGFIGCHLVRRLVLGHPDWRVICVDCLTYAGSLENLADVEGRPNYRFVQLDICDFEGILALMREEAVDSVIHLAAESHVDRSISDPFSFARTNVMGTLSLLQAARIYWESRPEGYEGKRFHHVSTDEVYGALPLNGGSFSELDRYDPHSPYSASKASSDHFVRAFHDTYGMPVSISNCSNNYGPNQYPEKLIPLCISRIVAREKIPVYGSGQNVRDWLYVGDHAAAIELIFLKGESGRTYNVGGGNEWRNLDLVRLLIRETDRQLGRPEGSSEALISFVTDRAGHDLRYAIDASRIREELGWKPEVSFGEGIRKTVGWYLRKRVEDYGTGNRKEISGKG